jgi:hypothetical protein
MFFFQFNNYLYEYLNFVLFSHLFLFGFGILKKFQNSIQYICSNSMDQCTKETRSAECVMG